MRSSRRVRPQVLPLEGRTLMSGTPFQAPAVAVQVARRGDSAPDHPARRNDEPRDRRP